MIRRVGLIDFDILPGSEAEENQALAIGESRGLSSGLVPIR